MAILILAKGHRVIRSPAEDEAQHQNRCELEYIFLFIKNLSILRNWVVFILDCTCSTILSVIEVSADALISCYSHSEHDKLIVLNMMLPICNKSMTDKQFQQKIRSTPEYMIKIKCSPLLLQSLYFIVPILFFVLICYGKLEAI